MLLRYEIVFSKLFIQFNKIHNSQEKSLLDFTDKQNEFNPLSKMQGQADFFLQNKAGNYQNVIEFMSFKEKLSSPTEAVSESDLSKALILANTRNYTWTSQMICYLMPQT